MSEQNAIFLNPHMNPLSFSSWGPPSKVLAFHKQLPDYAVTPLISLPRIAKELNLASVQVKDESLRLGLPAFKILGASWAVYRAVCEATSQPLTISLHELTPIAQAHGVHLVTCTEGNWGRAVARMARYMGIKAHISVPNTMDEATKDRIRSEGAHIQVADGNYDVSIRAAEAEAERNGGLLVMDVAWQGYETVPEWVVEGYSTMLRELDAQLDERLGDGGSEKVDLVIASAGVGSFAQAVTAHFKGKKRDGMVATKMVAVEPTTAACLQRSLKEGKVVSIETQDTIMCGMNCGTVSTTSWPILKDGVNAAVAVEDGEAHDALLAMKDEGMDPGPCGAAPLAALRKVCEAGLLNLDSKSHVVLFCTEGWRPYEVTK